MDRHDLRDLLGAITKGFVVAFFVLIAISAIHEYGHIHAFQSENVTIFEVCILGWRNMGTNWGFGTTAWVAGRGFYDPAPHDWWDYVWSFGAWQP